MPWNDLRLNLISFPWARDSFRELRVHSTWSGHQQAAREALKLARQRMQAGSWDLLILDEINNAVHLGLLDLADVMELVKNKPAKLHLVLTGRNAHPDVIAAADLVTEMRAIKHPYDHGVPAQRGIDF